MALETYNDIAAALSRTFDKQLYHQFNRAATTLALIEARPATDKTLSWDVEFSGNSAGTVAEGSDVEEAEFTTDKPVPAGLNTALYRSAFKMSDSELKKAAISGGSPAALIDILGDRMMTAVNQLASKINRDIFVGTGTDVAGNPSIVGLLGGALTNTGSYAGISRSTYPEWQATVIGNGGTPRPLTVDLLNQGEEQLFTKCGRSPTFMMGSAGIRRKYSNIFEVVRRVVGDGVNQTRQGAGFTDVYYQGEPVRRDKDAPAGTLIMGVWDYIRVEFLPPLGPDRDTVLSRMAALQGNTGNPNGVVTATAIPIEITPLAKTGNSVKFFMSVELQMKVMRPNAFVVFEDILEA